MAYVMPDTAKCYGYKSVTECKTCARNKNLPLTRESLWMIAPKLTDGDFCKYKINAPGNIQHL